MKFFLIFMIIYNFLSIEAIADEGSSWFPSKKESGIITKSTIDVWGDEVHTHSDGTISKSTKDVWGDTITTHSDGSISRSGEDIWGDVVTKHSD